MTYRGNNVKCGLKDLILISEKGSIIKGLLVIKNEKNVKGIKHLKLHSYRVRETNLILFFTVYFTYTIYIVK